MGSEPSDGKPAPGQGPPGYGLFRVDDRLLHGQVALGWGRRLHPRCFLLADDVLADDPGAAELYRAAAPEGTQVLIAGLEELRRRTDGATGGGHDPGRTILLVRGISQAARLLDAGIPGPLNLGGLHLRPMAREVLPYLFLTPEDERTLLRLLEQGHSIYAQDLPESPPQAAAKWLPGAAKT